MLSKAIRQFVFERASLRCEYCQSPMDFTYQSFELDHVIPISKKGTDDLDNLACACGGCNAFKHNKIEGKDPLDSVQTAIFNPRKMIWKEHFGWSNDFLEIIGLTNIGRTSILMLKLNRKGLVNIRRLLVSDGVHPPQ